jgi:hypothetical protein
MRAPTSLVPRLLHALPAAALLAAAGCAHAPPRQASAGDGEERPARVLVTGSRIPRPVGRDGLPVTEFPVRIYLGEDFKRLGYVDLARGIRTADVNAQ